MACLILMNWRVERFGNGIDHISELLGDLVQTFLTPVSEPVDHTTVEQSGRRCSAVREVRVAGIHREDDVKVALHVLYEEFVDLVIVGDIFGVGLLELTEQQHVLLSFEETRNLTRCQ